jgi:hypothetical protein
LQHNAFRAPGAPSVEQLQSLEKKVYYYTKIYSNMHKAVIPHSDFLSDENIEILDGLSYVFICIDKGSTKKAIIQYLKHKSIPFVDTGIGLHVHEDTLLGQARVTVGLPNLYDKISRYIDQNDNEVDDAYQSNIQIAEINALNACLAVIQWKKYCNFYQDVSSYNNIIYSINDGELFNEEV